VGLREPSSLTCPTSKSSHQSLMCGLCSGVVAVMSGSSRKGASRKRSEGNRKFFCPYPLPATSQRKLVSCVVFCFVLRSRLQPGLFDSSTVFKNTCRARAFLQRLNGALRRLWVPSYRHQETIVRHAVDYFFAPHSPWTYLGHARFSQLALDTDASVRVLPVDLAQ